MLGTELEVGRPAERQAAVHTSRPADLHLVALGVHQEVKAAPVVHLSVDAEGQAHTLLPRCGVGDIPAGEEILLV